MILAASILGRAGAGGHAHPNDAPNNARDGRVLGAASSNIATNTPGMTSHPATTGMHRDERRRERLPPHRSTSRRTASCGLSKIVGASVYNDQNQSIGSIDDVLMSDNDNKAGTAVMSVGGFLGMGSKLVSVPFDQLKIQNDKIVMPGATKAVARAACRSINYNNA